MILSNLQHLEKNTTPKAKLKALHEAVTAELNLVNDFIRYVGKSKSVMGNSVTPWRSKSGATGEAITKSFGQKYLVSDANTITTNPNVNMFFEARAREFDTGFLQIFDAYDLSNSNQETFTVYGLNGSRFTFKETPKGHRVKVTRHFAGDEETFKGVEYTEGMGLSDNWLHFNKWWNIDEAINEFLFAAARDRANNHYNLIIAQSAAIDVAFDTSDTVTFNKAASHIARAMETKGRATNGRLPIILHNQEQKGRLLNMLEAKAASPRVNNDSSLQPLSFEVGALVQTSRIPADADHYYLIQPGGKNKTVSWKGLTVESTRDIYHAATDWVGRENYNAIVGDVDQIRRVKLT